MAESDLDIIQGSDVLVHVNTGTAEVPVWKPVAHQTSCSISNSATTKERVQKSTGKWKGKKVVGLATTIKCDALASYDADGGYDVLNALFKAGASLLVKYSGTEIAGKKYEQGLFVITSLERNDPAQDDSTMSVTLENDGEIETKTVVGA